MPRSDPAKSPHQSIFLRIFSGQLCIVDRGSLARLQGLIRLSITAAVVDVIRGLCLVKDVMHPPQ